MNHIRKVTDLRSGTVQAGILRYAETRNVKGQVIGKHRIRQDIPDDPPDLEDKVTGYGTFLAFTVALVLVLLMAIV